MSRTAASTPNPDLRAGVKRSLVYVTHMTYPSFAAHAIQISRTVSALGRLARVRLIVKKMARSVGDAEKMYDLELRDQVEFIEFRARFGILGVAWMVWRMCRDNPGPFVFYTRSYEFAKHLIRLRPWHRRQVFFESHKKLGYHKEDFVEASEFSGERGAQEADNEPIELIQRVYKQSDCVFFLHEHSREIAAAELGLRRTVWNWYGIDMTKPLPERVAKFDFIYCGSVSKGKLVSLLLDAAALMRKPFSFHIFGRCDEATRTWLNGEIAARNLGASLSYEGMLPFSELQDRLPDYRFGIATMQGIKVVDYMENGLTLVIPRIVSHEEVFGDDEVCYYIPDDATDLARAMSECLASDRRRVSTELRERFSLANRAQRIAEQLVP